MQRFAMPYVRLASFARFSFFVLAVQLVLTSVCFARKGNGQDLLDKRLDLHLSNVTFPEVLTAIEKASSVHFVYRSNLFNSTQKLTVNSQQEKLKTLLQRLFTPHAIQFQLSHDNFIILSKDVKESTTKPVGTILVAARKVADTTILLQGRVTSNGVPVAGASVMLEGTTQGATTNENGVFAIGQVRHGVHTLVVSHVSYAKSRQKIVATGENLSLSIEMPEDPLQLQQVVVTSTGNPKKKIESSVAITTLTNRQMELRAPLNSADMLKAIPGIWVESSGGDGPGNTSVRGLPSTNGYQFMTLMEDGLPVLPAGFGSLPSADQYFKADLTLKNVEAIRGGSAPILMFNSAGAVANNLSYTGGARPYGKIKLTTGLSQDLYRVDANTGGKLDADNRWNYNIGGFYRTDKGIRPTSYTPNLGGQLKANLTRNFKNNSFVRVYGKYLNDKTQWLEPGYYAYNPARRGVALPQYDLFRQSIISSDTKFSTTLPEGNTFNFDLSNGYHTQSAYGGMLLNFNTANGWHIKNNFRYQHTDVNASFSFVGGPVAFNSSQSYYYLDGTQLQNPTGFFTTQAMTNTAFTDKQLVNYLDFGKKLGKHSINFGTGYYRYHVVDNESLGFVSRTEIREQPRRLLINTTTGNGITPNYLTAPGGHTKFNGKTTITSIYANDEFAVSDRLRIDAGVRLDRVSIAGQRASHTKQSNGFAITGYVPFTKDTTYMAATLGANYKFTEAYAMYVRATKAFNAINIGDLSSLTVDPNRLKKRDIYMAELGAKYAKDRLGFFGSLVFTEANNMPFNHNIPTAAGGTVGQSTFGSSRTYSFELEATYRLLRGLTLRGTTTLQNAKYTHYEFDITAVGVRPELFGKHMVWTGNYVARVPKVSYQFSADYEYKAFNAFANLQHFGKRWSTAAQTYELGAYNETNVGVGYKWKGFELRSWVNNLLNSRGLTEGNTRGDQFLDASKLQPGQLMIGRTTLPRSFWMSVSYTL